MTQSKVGQKWNSRWQDLKGNDSFHLSMVVSIMVLLIFVTNAVDYLAPTMKVDFTVISKASKIILFLLLVCNVKAILRRMTAEKIWGLVVVALLFLASFCITKDRPLLRSILLQFCLTVLPVFVVVSCIDDYGILLSALIWVSRIITIFAFALLFSKAYNRENYYMGLANAITLPTVMLLYNAYKSGNVIDFALAIVDSLVIFILGSRGALLGIIVFFIILLAAGMNQKDRRIISILFLALIFLSLLFFQPLVNVALSFLKQLGLNSRTLNMLLEGNITFHHGRAPIYSGMKAELKLHPFVIRGIGGERPFANEAYAHNFIYELLMDFGAILGGVAVVFLLYRAFCTIGEAVVRGDDFSMTKLIFLSVSLPIAFVSGTIWGAVYLWCWMVLCDKRYPALAGVPIKGTREGKLLSIVIPTKNRYTYLYSFIDLCATFPNKDFELVIQDNSDDNREILTFLSRGAYDFVSYHYDPSPLSMSQNSDLAVQHACGRYICFMGDDDLLSGKLVDFVGYMEQKDIDSAVFNTSQYNWPGVTHKAHRFPNLTIRSFDGQMRKINVKREYRWLLRTGTVALRHMPQLYHGVVRKAILDQVYDAYGTNFPGPSPDMAICVALVPFIKKHVYYSVPLISSGASLKSSAGLGARHMHKGELKSVAFLPKDIEEKWDERIPKVWTGPTIYAQSTFEALKAGGREMDIKRFNFAYFLAFFDTFCEDYRELSKAYRKKNKINELLYTCYRASIFLLRAGKFVSNKLLLTIQMGGKLADGLPNTVEAQRVIDEEIEKVPLPFRVDLQA